jgi:hypothetical protein
LTAVGEQDSLAEEGLVNASAHKLLYIFPPKGFVGWVRECLGCPLIQ